jgi:glutamate racemase
LLSPAIARSLGDKIQLVDSAKSCARAVEDLLDRQSLRASATEKGNLLVALTDAADNFLRVAREALKLELAEVKVCEIFDSSSTGCLHERN